jgi:hypothetical protein
MAIMVMVFACEISLKAKRPTSFVLVVRVIGIKITVAPVIGAFVALSITRPLMPFCQAYKPVVESRNIAIINSLFDALCNSDFVYKLLQ